MVDVQPSGTAPITGFFVRRTAANHKRRTQFTINARYADGTTKRYQRAYTAQLYMLADALQDAIDFHEQDSLEK